MNKSESKSRAGRLLNPREKLRFSAWGKGVDDDDEGRLSEEVRSEEGGGEKSECWEVEEEAEVVDELTSRSKLLKLNRESKMSSESCASVWA